MILKTEIIDNCKKVHGDEYDYSPTPDYIQNVNSKIFYICKKHGLVEQTYYNHWKHGKKCKQCAEEHRGENRRYTLDEFIEKAKLTHDDIDNYDFSKVDIFNKDNKRRINMYCKKHGYYLVNFSSFLKGIKCPRCTNYIKDDEEVRNELSKIHPFYDFSETKFSERDEKNRIKFICPKHGTKYMNYYNLLYGEGCDECGTETAKSKLSMSLDDFIKRAEEIFGKNRFVYSKVNLLDRDEFGRVCVICPKHGEFWVTPGNFLNKKSGCPICKQSKLEMEIRFFLSNENVKYIQQKRFSWLGRQSLDFYLPDQNIAIECQGEQHFSPMHCFGGSVEFEKLKERDIRKYNICKKNGIKIIYFSKSNITNDFPFTILTSTNDILKEIKNAS